MENVLRSKNLADPHAHREGPATAVTRYAVNDIYATFQGEGCQTGMPMVLVRLQGCGVGCPWCDTKETWTRETQTKVSWIGDALGASPMWAEMDPEALALYCRLTFPGPTWILLTGGEPAEQSLAALVRAFHAHGYRVALETSGTQPIDAEVDWLCVSPKVDMPGGRIVLPDVVKRANEIKMVVGSLRDVTTLEQLLGGDLPLPHQTVCVQPVSQSVKATALCEQIALQRGWRLSVQTHKVLNHR